MSISRTASVLIERFQVERAKKVRALSKGNRQKVQLIHTFSTRADLLLLDEPTSGLDPLMEVAFRATVMEAKERAQSVFLSSHILSEVEALCDRVGILRAGRLVDEGTSGAAPPSSRADHRGDLRGTGPRSRRDGRRDRDAGRVTYSLRFEVTGQRRDACWIDWPVRVLFRSPLESRRSRRSSCTTTAWPMATRHSPAVAVARRVIGDARTRALSFAALFFVVVWANAVGYRSTYPDLTARQNLVATFADNAAARILYGLGHDLTTIGGYTAWRGWVLTLFAGLFGIFADGRGAAQRRGAWDDRTPARWSTHAGPEHSGHPSLASP